MRRILMLAVLIGSAILVTDHYARPALATPSSGFTATTLAMGRLGDIDVVNRMVQREARRSRHDDEVVWLSRQKTRGDSDLYVQSNVWEPGGTTGWHTHPGHSLIIVTAGTVTAYDGDDPTCTPHVYEQGMALVDAGGDHVHLIRNEGTVEARTIAVQLIPAAAVRRIDAPDPGYCGF